MGWKVARVCLPPHPPAVMLDDESARLWTAEILLQESIRTDVYKTRAYFYSYFCRSHSLSLKSLDSYTAVIGGFGACLGKEGEHTRWDASSTRSDRTALCLGWILLSLPADISTV